MLYFAKKLKCIPNPKLRKLDKTKKPFEICLISKGLNEVLLVYNVFMSVLYVFLLPDRS